MNTTTDVPAPPFPRTTCDCADCINCCKSQPGYLLPGEMERIAAYRQEPSVLHLFRASPGAVVGDMRTGRRWSVRTIVPHFDKRTKRCVFLDAADHCTIHPVAPFGCAYFDTHMSAAEGQRRSAWGLRHVMDDPSYPELRGQLAFADTYNPKGF
jgi:Fe-S-cluster containining protein